MKARAILTFFIAILIFAVIAIQLHREAKAEIQDTQINITISTTDGQSHGPYIAELVNLTTHAIISLPSIDRKPGAYPSVHGGPCPHASVNDEFIVHVCSAGHWGGNTETFHITSPDPINFNLTVSSTCPAYSFKNE